LYHVEFQQDVDSQEAKQIDIKALDASTSSAASYRSAVFSPDHKRLAFLATRDVVTHNTCSMLCVLNWQTKETSTVIEIVQEPPVGYSTTGALQAFTGLYCGSLSSKAWSNDGRFIFFNTQMGARVLWKYVEVDAKKILSPPYIAGSPSELASETILDQDGDFVLVSVSSPSAPSSVYLVEIDPNTQQYKQKPIEIVNQSTISKYIKEWSIVPIEVPEDEGSSKKFSSTASKAPLLPQNNSKSPYEASILIPTCQAPAKGYPVLVDVHGGPHGNSPAMYRAVYEYFSALGFVVITVNYRGSTGYGIGPLESLVGKVGTQDIQDVQRAVLHLLDTSKAPLDRTRVSCSGGSHGGFIGAHLVSQYPTFYRCGILRNPVTNISSQFFTSDIPDWGCAVTGIRRFESITAFQSESQKIHQDKKPLTPEERLGVLARMWEMSPMANDLSKVQAPVLLGIGAKDRRVPTTEGLQFRDSIEAFGVETKLLWYPEDCHPLDSFQAYADFAVNWALWLLKHGN
jgi:acylaminoacyl-peptidase